MARRLYRVVLGLLRSQPAHKDDIEAWDPELVEYLMPEDGERRAKWLTNQEGAGAAVDEIKIWVFEEAPRAYKKLSDNGGDEDWLMFVPDRLEDDPRVIALIDSSAFSRSGDAEEHDVDGGVVYIGSHA